ncbi:PepSY-associated TM helix domain-containing protein [Acinetobacter kookii]
MQFRQVQAILHSWFGIVVLWSVFLIFFTGSIAYFRTEINLWSKPENFLYLKAPPSSLESAQVAYDYLNTHAPDAKRWRVNLATSRMPFNTLEWQDQTSKYHKLQDPNTGLILTEGRESLGGDFFFKLHYSLYPLPDVVGRTLVVIVGVLFLIALITGIFTHKKIIKDFFVFRSFKGQRTLLDLHHITGVVTLPFYLIMAFTGVMIFFYLLMPMGINQQYGENGIKKFYSEIQYSNVPKPAEDSGIQLKEFSVFSRQLPQQGSNGAVLEKFEVKNPNTAEALITFDYGYNKLITFNNPQFIFAANTGKNLSSERNLHPVAQISSATYGIHLGYYASQWMRWMLASLGLIGCIMLVAGALLWQKKHIKQHNKLSYTVVSYLNYFTFLGLPLATAMYFLANRILLASLEHRVQYELLIFFMSWIGILVIPMLVKMQKAIVLAFILTAFILWMTVFSPIFLSPQAFIFNTLWHQQWSVAGVDLVFIFMATGYIFACYYFRKIKMREVAK